ncbi:DEAD/DEAH box helicase [Microbacter margulisiae]|uniref:DEAD-box ATP-dependent RNA helicase RhpA n=1 Tax=Microbacter margulisiae TaxID=1350067 RepID=A0A7W5DT63_9PORP|nr:DEAD/DEAH box helicase [Microbacter margulisiae]MBB3188602.1 ATP-dependent RNA helicase RhlE [Microbacter margulisiae]
MTFKELHISEPIIKALEDKKYKSPTPIQEQAIPVVLRGHDLLGIAQTGTGKTAAFAIPIIQQLDQPQDKGYKREIKALILTPTRELAIQIDECFTDYAKYTGLRNTVIFGGVNQRPQVDRLMRGTDILVATPGRLLDLIAQKYINLDHIDHFVLDEADRMLDMGFIHDIKRLLPMLPKHKQTLFFSATMPSAITNLSNTILHHPVRVEIAPVASVVDTIEQHLYFVEKHQKGELLISLLEKDHAKSVLIFSRTKHGADKIARLLQKKGVDCEAIHGNKTQGARQRTLTNFKAGTTRVIVATDIAARGIDIAHLEVVINYDLPDVAETYVHRIGRTGRAGHSGTALTFCAQEERVKLRDIQQLTGKTLKTLSL